MGTPGHWLRLGHVRFGGASLGRFQRRISNLRLLLPPDGKDGGELSERQRHGRSFRQYAFPDPDPGSGDVRAHARSRRLHPLLLLLPVVSLGFQKGAALSGRIRFLGGHLGRSICGFFTFRPVSGLGSSGNLPGNHPVERNGLYRYHQVLQW